MPICYKSEAIAVSWDTIEATAIHQYSYTLFSAASFVYCSQVSLSFYYVSTGSVMFDSYFMSCHIFSIFVSWTIIIASTGYIALARRVLHVI